MQPIYFNDFQLTEELILNFRFKKLALDLLLSIVKMLLQKFGKGSEHQKSERQKSKS
jgi:hypothetical protein